MPPWLSIALPCVLFSLTVVMNVVFAVVNLKIKFAPSLDEAKQDLKQFALRVIPWILNPISIGSLVYSLFLNLSSNDPLTRLAVFSIAYNVATLMMLLMSLLLLYFIKRVDKRVIILNDIVNDVVKILPDTFQGFHDAILIADQLSKLRLEEHESKSSQ